MSRLNTLKGEFENIKRAIAVIEEKAEAEGRDLNDDESADVDRLFARAESIKPELEKEADKADTMNAVGSILDRITPAAKRASVVESYEPMTAGEFLSNALKVQAGLMSADEHLTRAQRAQMVVTDNAGIVPAPIVGNLIELYNAERPVFNSFTARPMPQAGKTFTRPKITQHVSVGNQASEFGTVSTQKMTIGSDTVTKATEAGYLDLSQQDIDWTDPSALQLVIQDFAKVYSRRTEVLASQYLVSRATTTATWNVSNVTNAVTTFVDAFLAVGDSEANADTVWIDQTSWATLAKLTTTNQDRTGISMIQEALSTFGVGPVKWVVGRNFIEGATPSPVRIVGDSSLIESYEQTNGFLQVAQPEILGQRIAYSAYTAFFATSAGFRKLV